MFGVTEFSAVINPPQAAILAIGSSRIQPSEYSEYRVKLFTLFTVNIAVSSQLMHMIVVFHRL